MARGSCTVYIATLITLIALDLEKPDEDFAEKEPLEREPSNLLPSE